MGGGRKPWALSCNNGFGKTAMDASILLFENYKLPIRYMEQAFCDMEKARNWTCRNYVKRCPDMKDDCKRKIMNANCTDDEDYGRDELFLKTMVRPHLESARRTSQLH